MLRHASDQEGLFVRVLKWSRCTNFPSLEGLYLLHAAPYQSLVLQATSKPSSGNGSRAGSAHGGKGNNKRSWGQSQAEDLSLDTALRLYGLERMEVLWERRLDTMALIAWGSNRIVVVFRGTNSLKNVLADLEVGGPHAHVWLWLIEPAKVLTY